jgi:hypothetical protein
LVALHGAVEDSQNNNIEDNQTTHSGDGSYVESLVSSSDNASNYAEANGSYKTLTTASRSRVVH